MDGTTVVAVGVGDGGYDDLRDAVLTCGSWRPCSGPLLAARTTCWGGTVEGRMKNNRDYWYVYELRGR